MAKTKRQFSAGRERQLKLPLVFEGERSALLPRETCDSRRYVEVNSRVVLVFAGSREELSRVVKGKSRSVIPGLADFLLNRRLELGFRELSCYFLSSAAETLAAVAAEAGTEAGSGNPKMDLLLVVDYEHQPQSLDELGTFIALLPGIGLAVVRPVILVDHRATTRDKLSPGLRGVLSAFKHCQIVVKKEWPCGGFRNHPYQPFQRVVAAMKESLIAPSDTCMP